MMRESIQLPIIDLNSPDPISTARTIRQACIEVGFFYLVNHGIDEKLFKKVIEQSKKFFSLPLEEKMKLVRRNHRGYTPLYAEKLDPSSTTQGDSKESFYIGSLEGKSVVSNLNQWPPEVYNNNNIPSEIPLSEAWEGTVYANLTTKWGLGGYSVRKPYYYLVEIDGLFLKDPQLRLLKFVRLYCEVLPCWRSTLEDYHRRVLYAGVRLISLVALALDLDEDFFHKAGACDSPNAFLRLLHYPGELQLSEQVVYGASAHSDYGMLTLLATDGVDGLQVCREKFKRPQIWEDVHHLSGAFIVNIGDMMERWTNCLFRSTLHRVMPTGQERYSMAFFLDPNPDCVVECLKSCCSDSSPPRFPPIRAGEYLEERLKVTYAS